jgi:hypothetical protein
LICWTELSLQQFGRSSMRQNGQIAEDDVSCRVVEMQMRVEELRRASSSFTFDPAPKFATELRRLLRIDRKQSVFGQDGACVGIPTGPDPGVHALAEAL